jgi:hypothetical protein
VVCVAGRAVRSCGEGVLLVVATLSGVRVLELLELVGPDVEDVGGGWARWWVLEGRWWCKVNLHRRCIQVKQIVSCQNA